MTRRFLPGLCSLILLLSACTDGDEFFVNPRLDRPGNVSASQIDEITFARDDLALTPADANVGEVLTVQADQPPTLLGPRVLNASEATGFLFQAGQRLFVSHRDTNGNTPALELAAPDRDFSVGIDFSATILAPIRLNSYRDGNNNPVDSVNRRANYWIVIYSYQTLRQSSNGSVGPRKALAYHVFRPDVKGRPFFDDPDFGRLEFGWQVSGRQIPLQNQQAGADVVGFALLSDSLVGSAHFSSSAAAHSATTTQPVAGTPGAASYRFGQAMTRFGLLIFQQQPDDPATATPDSRMATLYSSLDIGELTFETGSEVAVPAGHFQAANTGEFLGASAYDPSSILVSNQHAMLLLRDATRVGATTTIQSTEIVATVLTIIDQQDGTSVIRLQADTDLSLNGSEQGFHGAGFGERATIRPNLVALGPDEGIDGQTLFFFTVNDGRNSTDDPDTDLQIHVAAVNSRSGTIFEGELVNRPQRLSRHLDTATNAVTDPVLNAELRLNRDGTAAILAYRQFESSAAGAGIGLNAVVIKLDSGSGFPGSRFTPEIRIDQPQSDNQRILGSQLLADVSQFRLQNGLKANVGNQIDSQRFMLLYEQSGNTRDQVFAVTLELDTVGIPGLTVRPELELETLFPVVNDAGTRDQAFLEQSVDLSQFDIVDIGLDINQSHQWLIVFPKEADNETVIDDLGDIDIFGQFIELPTDLRPVLASRVRLDDTDEMDGQGRTRRTAMVSAFAPIAATTNQFAPVPGFLTVLFQQPGADNVSSGLGLFVRTLDLNRYRGDPNSGVSQLFFPQLTERSSRLDNGLGDVEVAQFQSSDRLNLVAPITGEPAIFREPQLRSMILFRQDGHLFASETQNGLTYSQDLQRADPQILDNDSFGTTIPSLQQTHFVPFERQDGSSANGSSLLYLKATNQSLEQRVLIRFIRPPSLF